MTVEGATIVTADPAEGTVARERELFESRWSGNVLLAARPRALPNRDMIDAALCSVLGRRALLDRLSLSWTGGGR